MLRMRAFWMSWSLASFVRSMGSKKIMIIKIIIIIIK